MTEYRITRLGHQGDGIAAGPVFAPMTLPGEVVTGVQTGDRLHDVRIVKPSADRVSPVCRHYKACGGCQVMHASDAFVAEWKTGVVRAALTAQGIEAAFRPILTSPPRSRRRAAVSVRRTKKGALAGFHARASDTVIQIPDCQLLLPELLGALPLAEALATSGASRKGELTVQVTHSDGGLDVLVTDGKPLDGPLRVALAAEVERFRLARLVWGDELVGQRQPPFQQFGQTRIVPPPGAFMQATAEGEAALLSAVKEAVAGATRIVDLFAGCGTFALPLAQDAEVHAVEGEADMLKALDQGWRQTSGSKRVSTETRDLFRRPLLPDELKGFDAAVIDPPRAGAEAQVHEIAKAGIGRIAFVSCNPVTFARDAKTLLSAGYRLEWVQVVDQFRWSTHVELAAAFTAPHI
ncbi:MAG: class I SAM-dependent RNA methyltransferase [Paracoccaceae bacterium]